MSIRSFHPCAPPCAGACACLTTAACRAILIAWLFALLTLSAAAAAEPLISPQRIPAAGQQQAILHIPELGRYAIMIDSKQGVAIQIVDKMSGPGNIAGSAGETDGRLDLLLDAGAYKIVTRGHDNAAGDALLSVKPFRELAPEAAPRPLLSQEWISASLDDFEQISFWFKIEDHSFAFIEAGGRNLSDLRLWRNGEWLVDTTPALSSREGGAGDIWRSAILNAQLSPGWYRLTAYGGPSQPWASGGNEHPLHLRYGLPELATNGCASLTVSPLGIDRFILPGASTYVSIELPEAHPAVLGTAELDEFDPLGQYETRAEISKESRVPRTGQNLSDSSSPRLVSIHAPAGQRYLLTHMRPNAPFTKLTGAGRLWLSTLSDGAAGDVIDPTAIVTRSRPKPQEKVEVEIVDAIAPQIGPGQGWARRFNITGATTLHVRIVATGRYVVLVQGVKLRARFEPFMISRPSNYETPRYRSAGEVWDLSEGIYELTFEPETLGIVEAVIRNVADTQPALAQAGETFESTPRMAAVIFANITFDAERTYWIRLNTRPEVRDAIIFRELPLDLTNPLAIALAPSETVPLLTAHSDPVRICARGSDGQPWEISVAGGSGAAEVELDAGEQQLLLRNPTDAATVATVRVEASPAAAEQDKVTSQILADLPQLPELGLDNSEYLDLPRQGSHAFLIRITEAGLYEFRSLGLQDAAATLGNRFTPVLFEDADGADGRNFLIQQYLRQGSYQLTVRLEGRSEGHFGVGYRRATLASGGTIAPDRPGRRYVPAGTAVAYDLAIANEGRYRLRCFGPSADYPYRLEDGDGWPLEPPPLTGSIVCELDPGEYRLVALPIAVDARRLTVVQRESESIRVDGHGPHRLALGQTAACLWREPGADAERQPDVWEFDWPASATALLTMTGEMTAAILRQDEVGNWNRTAAIPPGWPWREQLAAGRYRLEAMCSRKNDWLDYSITIDSAELVPGMTRAVNAPASIPVKVGMDGMIEFSSFGQPDVRADLYDGQGELLASGDDRPGDWNFLITRWLAEGSYTLDIAPLTGARARTEVTMSVRREETGEPLTAPYFGEVQMAEASRVFPLILPAGANLLDVDGHGNGVIGCSVEGRQNGGWQSLGSSAGDRIHLAIPLVGLLPAPSDSEYRLRLWSVDAQSGIVAVQIQALALTQNSEQTLASGLWLSSLTDTAPPGSTGPPGAAFIALERPGVFRFPATSLTAPLEWSGTAGESTQPVRNRQIAAPSSSLWLWGAAPPKALSRIVTAERFFLSSGPNQAIELDISPGSVAHCDLATTVPGPVLAMATCDTGDPGLELVPAVAVLEPLSGTAMATAPGAALAIALHGGEIVARAWRASPGPAVPAIIKLHHIGFHRPVSRTITWGATEITIPGGEARNLILPTGTKRFQLTLGQGIAAGLADAQQILSTEWRGGLPFSVLTQSAATQLLLLNPQQMESKAIVELLPALDSAAPWSIVTDHALEYSFTNNGFARIPVPKPDAIGSPILLRIRGSRGPAEFCSDNGIVLRGNDLDITGAAGRLLIPHESGVILAWIDLPDHERAPLWSAKTEANPMSVRLPVSVQLAGSTHEMSFDQPTPGLLRLRVSCPTAIRLEAPDMVPRIEVFANGCDWSQPISAGKITVSFRALLGGSLWGGVDISVSDLQPTGEGIGASALLPPGGSAAFAFDVDQKTRIGIGVNASSETVESVVYDAAGRNLGNGLVQFLDLVPGSYILVLHLPPDREPAWVRPVLAGLRPPDTSPPEDIVRQYIERAKSLSFEPVPAPMTRSSLPGASEPHVTPIPEGNATPTPQPGGEEEYYE